ncbi:NAD(P)-binding protein [Microthyrium microscopicum]|uniref:NAD(P)-binding protein n=1 Tax=Microthyrium microscopicum TaxID=703497 RepID=A0A6A6UUR7_9PEZI|nr:NAD(P)-binding protein [Microthyrium microscopicum]
MNAIRKTLAQNVPHGNLFAKEGEKFTLDMIPDLSSKVAVVTGGSEGIGYGCTHSLLSKNISKLFILTPSQEVADGAQDAIREEMGGDVAEKVQWMRCDLSDWKQTGQVAFDIRKKVDRLDILINCAARGIMTQQLTPQGVDLHMSLNHIGHVVLTSHLLPLMKKTAESGNKVRIVNLGSNIHEQVPEDFKFGSIEEINKDYGPMKQYGISKLAAILYAKYLSRHLTSKYPNILANASHPGIVETRQSSEHIFEPYPLGGYAMKYGMAPFKKDQFEGALSTLYLATVTENSGEYVCPPAIVEEGSKLANNEQLGEQLMTLTKLIVREKAKAESVDKGCPLEAF